MVKTRGGQAEIDRKIREATASAEHACREALRAQRLQILRAIPRGYGETWLEWAIEAKLVTTMRYKSYGLVPRVGVMVGHLAEELIEAARILDDNVEITFNHVQIGANPRTTVDEILESYHQELSQLSSRR